jgi:hypothetical protein
MRLFRYSARILAAIVIFDGLFALFCAVAIGQARFLDWPVGDTAEALRLSDGRYAISVPLMNRIQIYSGEMQFLYGWPSKLQVETLRQSPDGTIHVYGYAKRGSHLNGDDSFDVNGTLLSAEHWDHIKDAPPGQIPQPVSVTDVPPWWTILLHTPFASFLMILLGALAFSATHLGASRQDRKTGYS